MKVVTRLIATVASVLVFAVVPSAMSQSVGGAEIIQAEPDRNASPPARPMLMDAQMRGKHCGLLDGEVFVGGDMNRYCISVLSATISPDVESGPSFRFVTLRSNYYQPGPKSSGKTIWWIDAQIRLDCSSGRIWSVTSRQYGLDGKLIGTQTPTPAREIQIGPGGQEVHRVTCA